MAELPGIAYDKSKIYHKEVILKKEGKLWTEYYAVLVDNTLVFNRKDSKTGQIIPNNVTMVEISNKTACGLDTKKCYRFPFWIQTGKVKYQFKCETKLHRYKWLYAIRKCAEGRPPCPIPKTIPTVTMVKGKPQRPSNGGANKSKAISNGSLKQHSQQHQHQQRPIPKKNPVLIRSRSSDTVLDSSSAKPEQLKSQKLSGSKNGIKLPFRSNSFNERSHKKQEAGGQNSKSKSTQDKQSSKIFRRFEDLNNNDLQDSVVENRHVKDSMSDVYKIDNKINKPNGVHQANGTLEDLNRSSSGMTLNDRFKSMSCGDILHIDNDTSLTKSINSNYSKEFFEYYLDEDGRKTPTDCPDIVDLDPKKQPTENDELDYLQKFDKQNSPVASHNHVLTSDRFGRVRRISVQSMNNEVRPSAKSLASKKTSVSSLVNKKSLDKLRKLDRASSCSCIGKIAMLDEPKRRENSAPSLKFSRHQYYGDTPEP